MLLCAEPTRGAPPTGCRRQCLAHYVIFSDTGQILIIPCMLFLLPSLYLKVDKLLHQLLTSLTTRLTRFLSSSVDCQYRFYSICTICTFYGTIPYDLISRLPSNRRERVFI